MASDKIRDVHIKKEVVKIGKRLNIVRTFITKSGEIVTRTISPITAPFERKDSARDSRRSIEILQVNSLNQFQRESLNLSSQLWNPMSEISRPD